MRPGLVTALLVVAACVVPEYGHAAPPPRHKLAPAMPCTMANRMDMFVDEDSIMWECSCEVLKTGHVCRWQVIGGVDAVTRKRFPRRRQLRIIAATRAPVLYVKPAVVG